MNSGNPPEQRPTRDRSLSKSHGLMGWAGWHTRVSHREGDLQVSERVAVPSNALSPTIQSVICCPSLDSARNTAMGSARRLP
jgi:hypothetical protein